MGDFLSLCLVARRRANPRFSQPGPTLGFLGFSDLLQLSWRSLSSDTFVSKIRRVTRKFMSDHLRRYFFMVFQERVLWEAALWRIRDSRNFLLGASELLIQNVIGYEPRLPDLVRFYCCSRCFAECCDEQCVSMVTNRRSLRISKSKLEEYGRVLPRAKGPP